MSIHRIYVVAVYARFNGLYYCARLEDFQARLDGEFKKDDEEAYTKAAQALVDEWERQGEPIPEPKFKKYTEFESSYADDQAHYYEIVLCIKRQTHNVRDIATPPGPEEGLKIAKKLYKSTVLDISREIKASTKDTWQAINMLERAVAEKKDDDRCSVGGGNGHISFGVVRTEEQTKAISLFILAHHKMSFFKNVYVSMSTSERCHELGVELQKYGVNTRVVAARCGHTTSLCETTLHMGCVCTNAVTRLGVDRDRTSTDDLCMHDLYATNVDCDMVVFISTNIGPCFEQGQGLAYSIRETPLLFAPKPSAVSEPMLSNLPPARTVVPTVIAQSSLAKSVATSDDVIMDQICARYHDKPHVLGTSGKKLRDAFFKASPLEYTLEVVPTVGAATMPTTPTPIQKMDIDQAATREHKTKTSFTKQQTELMTLPKEVGVPDPENLALFFRNRWDDKLTKWWFKFASDEAIKHCPTPETAAQAVYYERITLQISPDLANEWKAVLYNR